MQAALTRKLPQYATLLAAALLLNFFLPRAMPGSPLVLFAGGDAQNLTPAQQHALLQQLGLDRPLIVQFGSYLSNVAHGDFGFSYQEKRPVRDIIADRLKWTLLLVLTSLVIATFAGVTLGALAAWRRGKRIDLLLLGGASFLQSVPAFWVGMIFIAVIAGQLHLLPSFGISTPGAPLQVGDVAAHLVLPAVTLALAQVGGTFFVARYAMLNVLGEDYIRTARAKGASERRVFFVHGLRNALLPIVTDVTLNLGFAIGGATVVETVFAYPGMGLLIYQAVLGRDYPVLQASFLVLTVAVLAANFASDLVYPLLDPRLRRRG